MPHLALPAELRAVRALLAAAGLPLDGFDDCAEVFAQDSHGRVVGAVGYERHGEGGRVGLLRSLVVDPSQRGRGLGLTLLLRGVTAMRTAGVEDAYGLTTTIPDLLVRLGWEEVRRDQLPEALLASRELQGACPASARAFRFKLQEQSPT